MNKIPQSIEELHRIESNLAAELLRLSDRHAADHEIYHGSRDLARWSREHVRRLAEIGRSHGLSLDPEPPDDNAVLEKVRRKADEMIGRLHTPALLLLRDLRDLHKTAAGASLDWEVLAQSAQATKDNDLLSVAKECHPQTLRQMRWANAMVKSLSAQALVTD